MAARRSPRRISQSARSICAGAALEGVEDQRMNDRDAPRNRSLDEFRSYLLLLARLQLDSGPRNSTRRTSSSRRCSRRTPSRSRFTATTRPWQPGCGKPSSTTCATPGAPCAKAYATSAGNNPWKRRWSSLRLACKEYWRRHPPKANRQASKPCATRTSFASRTP